MNPKSTLATRAAKPARNTPRLAKPFEAALVPQQHDQEQVLEELKQSSSTTGKSANRRTKSRQLRSRAAPPEPVIAGSIPRVDQPEEESTTCDYQASSSDREVLTIDDDPEHKAYLLDTAEHLIRQRVGKTYIPRILRCVDESAKRHRGEPPSTESDLNGIIEYARIQVAVQADHYAPRDREVLRYIDGTGPCPFEGAYGDERSEK